MVRIQCRYFCTSCGNHITTIAFEEGFLTAWETFQIKCNACGKTGMKDLMLRIIEWKEPEKLSSYSSEVDDINPYLSENTKRDLEEE